MKTRLALFWGIVLLANNSLLAKEWDDLVFTATLTKNGKGIPHVPCNVSLMPGPLVSKWEYSDTNGRAEIKIPKGSATVFSHVQFDLGYGTAYYYPTPSNNWYGLNNADGKPDTIDINTIGEEEFFHFNHNSGKPDSLITTYTVVDAEDDKPIHNATVTLRYKYRAAETEVVHTETVQTDFGDARVALLNVYNARAVLVTVSADGYTSSQEFVDSMAWSGRRCAARGTITWDGENDVIPLRTIKLTKGNVLHKDSLFVTGKILNSAESPIAGAKVNIKLSGEPGAAEVPLGEVKSNGEGIYFAGYKNVNYWTTVTATIAITGAAGHLDSTVSARGTIERPSDTIADTLRVGDIKLEKAPQRDTLIIGGRLTDTSGTVPVALAYVKMYLGSSEGTYTDSLSARSDADGYYMKTWFNAGAIATVYGKIVVDGDPVGYFDTVATGNASINPSDSITDTLRIDAKLLKRPPVDTLVISGKVTDTSGVAVSGAAVTVNLDSVATGSYPDSAGTATSGADGAFTVRWKNVRQWTNVFVKVTAKAAAYADTSALASKSGIVPNDGAADSISGVNVKMRKVPAADTLLIGGLVTDESGTTVIPNAAVTIGISVDGMNFIDVASMQTGNTGIFYTKLVNTPKLSQFTVGVGVSAAGYSGAVEKKIVTIVPDDGKIDTVGFAVKLKKAVILPTDSVCFRGKVSALPGAAPVAGAAVKLSLGTDSAFYSMSLDATTGGAGTFEFRFANSGNITQAYSRLEITAKGYRPYSLKMRVTLSPGDGKKDTISIDDCPMVKLAPETVVVGGVVTNIMTKKVVARAKVTVTLASNQQLTENKCVLESAPTGADGVYLVSAPNPNRIKRIYFKIDAKIKETFMKDTGFGSTAGFVDINPEDEINDTICINLQMAFVSTAGGPSAVLASKPVTVKIYNLNGRLVKTIHSNTARVAGESARQIGSLGMQKLIIETKIDKNGKPQRRSKIAAK